MGVDAHARAHVGMRIGMQVGMCADMRADMCVDMRWTATRRTLLVELVASVANGTVLDSHMFRREGNK